MNESTYNFRGYTPQGQHDLPPTNVSGKIRCELTGPGDEERALYESNPDWRYTGELLPVIKRGMHV